jgi:hypothetical protein
MSPAATVLQVKRSMSLRLSVKHVEALLWILIAILTVILPNAFKEVAAGSLLLTALFYLAIKNLKLNLTIVISWFAIAAISLLYILIGFINGAPLEAGNQVLVIYVLSPMLWIICITGAIKTFGLQTIVKFLIFLTLLSILSQAFYYWAYTSGNFRYLLEYMAGSPNLDFSNNQVAAVMFVFGSMTFLYSCLFAAPEVVKGNLSRFILIGGAFVSAITSGRSALILAVGVGMLVFLCMSVANLKRMPKTQVINLSVIVFIPILAGYFLAALYGIDIFVSIETLVQKTISGGGSGRQDYIYLLLGGSADYFFLGAGHGIGVEYIVSERFPWRYEVVGAATLYRVGLVGLLVYALPFLLALQSAFRIWRRRGLNVYERFTLGGFVSSLIVLNTNPYIEAVVFQWMFVFPCVYFIQQAQVKSG